jgi:hypothetical protein
MNSPTSNTFLFRLIFWPFSIQLSVPTYSFPFNFSRLFSTLSFPAYCTRSSPLFRLILVSLFDANNISAVDADGHACLSGNRRSWIMLNILLISDCHLILTNYRLWQTIGSLPIFLTSVSSSLSYG